MKPPARSPPPSCADPASVRRYRLLGFAPVAGLAPGPLPTRLPAKTITSLVHRNRTLHRQPATSEPSSGPSTARPPPPVTIARHGDAEPSDDARFAALVCTYAQWLAREPSGLIDTDLLAALARETAAEDLPADRMDFLNLIDQSLNL